MAFFKITPTKANLMKVKAMLALMESSYTLLDKKRVVLLRAANAEQKKKADLEARLQTVSADFQEKLKHATVAMGHYRLESIAAGMPFDESITLSNRSYMGVEVTHLHYEESTKDELDYDTVHITLDFATGAMQEFKSILLELASVTDAADRLQREMLKTQKRANALEKVQIPKYKIYRDFIAQSLEEKEREEFFRLKLLKKKKMRKKQQA
ncbi:V-type ATP synthase subunit D [Murdochiella sp. Marseille-P8839]|nr:V-type ATP synthase subunit D [Murdochiella sp. Marseille-P8839]